MLLIRLEFPAHFPETRKRPVQNPAILNPVPNTMPLEFHQLDQCWEHLRVRHAGQQRQLIASLAETGQQTPIVVVPPSEENGRYVVIDGFRSTGWSVLRTHWSQAHRRFTATGTRHGGSDGVADERRRRFAARAVDALQPAGERAGTGLAVGGDGGAVPLLARRVSAAF